MTKLIALVLLLTMSVPAVAHPGHGPHCHPDTQRCH
jgi:hypothetical protein